MNREAYQDCIMKMLKELSDTDLIRIYGIVHHKFIRTGPDRQEGAANGED